MSPPVKVAKEGMRKSLYIFRRDFRLYDNKGLTAACKNSDQIIPIFNFTPEQIENEKNKFKSSNCVQFMIESLKDLDVQLDGKLNLMYGNYIDVIMHLKKQYGFNAIYCNTDYSPYAKKRESDIYKWCKSNGVEFHAMHDITLLPPGKAMNKQGKPFMVYTPFYNECTKYKIDDLVNPGKFSNFVKLKNDDMQIDFKETERFYQFNDMLACSGGRKNGLDILRTYNPTTYQKVRDDLSQGKTRTSSLSPYIKFGCISIREAYHQLNVPGGIAMIKQLFWRDYFIMLGHFFPHTLGAPLKPQFGNIKWNDDDKYFQLWCEGRTGFPVVDAAMTELNTTGYMNNRARTFVADFLVKLMQIDWRKGEKHFATKLIDYDSLVNNGSWQYAFSNQADKPGDVRVFNPWMQSSKFDANATYIKKWLPNLESVAPEDLHNWEHGRKKYNLARLDYVRPCLDYNKQRKAANTLYKSALHSMY